MRGSGSRRGRAGGASRRCSPWPVSRPPPAIRTGPAVPSHASVPGVRRGGRACRTSPDSDARSVSRPRRHIDPRDRSWPVPAPVPAPHRARRRSPVRRPVAAGRSGCGRPWSCPSRSARAGRAPCRGGRRGRDRPAPACRRTASPGSPREPPHPAVAAPERPPPHPPLAVPLAVPLSLPRALSRSPCRPSSDPLRSKTGYTVPDCAYSVPSSRRGAA